MQKKLYSEEQIGKRYGKLLIVSLSDDLDYGFNCVCDCGNKHVATVYNLRRGNVKSCGCLRSYPSPGKAYASTHGLSHTHEYKMWQTSKRRALESGLGFDLQPQDIVIPETCPVLGILLRKGPAKGKITDDSPSIDRYDNNKGYTKDNIRVISMKANRIKSTATIEDIEAVLSYMKGDI